MAAWDAGALPESPLHKKTFSFLRFLYFFLLELYVTHFTTRFGLNEKVTSHLFYNDICFRYTAVSSDRQMYNFVRKTAQSVPSKTFPCKYVSCQKTHWTLFTVGLLDRCSSEGSDFVEILWKEGIRHVVETFVNHRVTVPETTDI